MPATSESGRRVFGGGKQSTVSGVQPPVARGVTSVAPAHWTKLQAATHMSATALGVLLATPAAQRAKDQLGLTNARTA